MRSFSCLATTRSRTLAIKGHLVMFKDAMIQTAFLKQMVYNMITACFNRAGTKPLDMLTMEVIDGRRIARCFSLSKKGEDQEYSAGKSVR